MVKAAFVCRDGLIMGFTVSGHAGAKDADAEFDLICSAVSSAVYLVCNTLTEYVGGCKAKQDDNEISLDVIANSEAIQAVLNGFRSHLNEMAQQYPQNIKILGGKSSC